LSNGNITPLVRGKDVGVARQAALAVILGVLVLEAARFYLQSVGHFSRDYNDPAAWGRLWPNWFWLMLHVGGATLALFCGPFQLWSGLRNRHLSIHRWTGRLYVGGVFMGGASAFYLSTFVEPWSFGVALFSLGVAWWFTVGMAFSAIKRHQIEAHKDWMIRGYAVTYSFVTFRMWIGLPVWSAFGSARLAVVLWLSWIAPLLLVELFLRSRSNADRSSVAWE
jgi:uncharacterized membrane protein YozB (DUF420 family)